MNTEEPILKKLPIEQLARGQYQPRQYFDEQSLQELACSIQVDGIIQPIVVRPIAPHQYEIIAGERRWRAAQLAQLSEVPCLIFAMDNQKTAAITVVENIQRENLNPIEEAQAYQRLIEEFDYSHEVVGAMVGKSRVKITNSLRLLNLDSRVQHWLIEGVLSEGHGKVLLGLPLQHQHGLASQCVRHQWSVRVLEKAIKHVLLSSEEGIRASELVKRDPNIVRLERVISEHLGSPVILEQDAQQPSGWLKIRYFDSGTFSGLLERMGVVYE